jgi:hypothetical protein
VHPNQITDSKNRLLAKAAEVFGGEHQHQRVSLAWTETVPVCERLD